MYSAALRHQAAASSRGWTKPEEKKHPCIHRLVSEGEDFLPTYDPQRKTRKGRNREGSSRRLPTPRGEFCGSNPKGGEGFSLVDEKLVHSEKTREWAWEQKKEQGTRGSTGKKKKRKTTVANPAPTRPQKYITLGKGGHFPCLWILLDATSPSLKRVRHRGSATQDAYSLCGARPRRT